MDKSSINYCANSFNKACNDKIHSVNAVEPIFPENIDFTVALKNVYNKFLYSSGIDFDELYKHIANSFLGLGRNKISLFDDTKVQDLFRNCKSTDEKYKLMYSILSTRCHDRVKNVMRDNRQYTKNYEYRDEISTANIEDMNTEDMDFDIMADKIRDELNSLKLAEVVNVFDLILAGHTIYSIMSELKLSEFVVNKYIETIRATYLCLQQ